jgi:glycosyltransferase involved in cell wall biosynthesis
MTYTRVRVLIDYRPALRNPSGVGEYARQLVAGLEGKADITLFSSSWKDRLVRPAEPNAGEIEVVDLRLPVSALNFAWHRLGWPSAEALTDRVFDVTHSLHPLILPSRTAAQVVTIHDLNFLDYPERTRAEIRRDYPALARAHAHRADHIVVPSRFTRSEVERRLGVAAERISVCSPGAPDWAPRPCAPEGGYLLFFGTLEPRKNVGMLLDAYERLIARGDTGSSLKAQGSAAVPDLVLAGSATDASAPWLERLARAPLVGHARHIGYVDPAARRALYEGARVLLQPSFEEGFGLPALEAMTVGVPVVAANRGAIPEVVGDAGLLVDPDDAAAMAAAVARLLDDAALAAACASAGIERARGFHLSSMAEHVCEAYTLAIEHRARRRGMN